MITATYIILENKVILTKKNYKDWWEIQEEFYDTFMASLAPMTLEEFLSYLEDDFRDECNWPFLRKSIIEFYYNNNIETIESGD